MARERTLDALIVSLSSTEGLRRADEQLRDALARAGLGATIARASPPRQLRTLMLTDLAWAAAARRAAQGALSGDGGREVGAVIYSSTTAALLWPRPGVVRFDATSAANRPGRHGLWQRPLERRRLAQATLLLPWSEGALMEGPRGPRAWRERALVLPVAVAPSGPAGADTAPPQRQVAAVTYAADPAKKGLDRVLSAWRELRRSRASGEREELVIAGAEQGALARAGVLEPGEEGVRVAGRLSQDEYRSLLRSARVFVCAPRREDYGISQLEALADGCQLVTTPAPGPYAALPIARALDPRLVSGDLAGALRAALEEPTPDYAVRARAALAAFRPEAVERIIAEQLLPRLFP